MENLQVVTHIAELLRKLPDVERLLGRVKSSFQSSSLLSLPLLGSKLLKQRVRIVFPEID